MIEVKISLETAFPGSMVGKMQKRRWPPQGRLPDTIGMLVVVVLCAGGGALVGAAFAIRWPFSVILWYVLGRAVGTESMINAGGGIGAVVGGLAGLVSWYRHKY